LARKNTRKVRRYTPESKSFFDISRSNEITQNDLKDLLRDVLLEPTMTVPVREGVLDMYESLVLGHALMQSDEDPVLYNVGNYRITEKGLRSIKGLLESNRKMKAIKDFRMYTSAGLKEAKEAVEGPELQSRFDSLQS